MKQGLEAVEMFRWVTVAGIEDMFFRALEYGVTPRELHDEIAAALERALVRMKVEEERANAGH